MSFLTYLPLGGNKSEEKYVPVCNFVIEQKGNSHLDQPLMNSRKEINGGYRRCCCLQRMQISLAVVGTSKS